MKIITFSLLVLSSKVLLYKTQKFKKFEPSLKYCRKFEISEYLSNGKCVYVWKSLNNDFLCKFGCTTIGMIRLSECQLNTYNIKEPRCEELICEPGEEEVINKGQCELITEWRDSLLCSYQCDKDNYVRLEECDGNSIETGIPLCDEVQCPMEQVEEEQPRRLALDFT